MPKDSMAFARIDAGAHEAATGHNRRPEPTEAQKLAGNYKMGRAEVQGLKVVIENPRGTFRCGVGADGNPWSTRVAAHYGYLAGTRGADGDPVDVFVGPFPESSQAWVINQRDAGGGFDEHKVMLGFHTEDQARAAYLGSYTPGWTGLKSIVAISIDQLRVWAKSRPRSELTPDQLKESAVMDRVTWGQDAHPISHPINRLMYALRAEDAADGLLLDAVSMADLMGAPELEGHAVLDALVVEVGRLQPKMDALMRVMQLAGESVKPVSVTISDPVRARGVLNVMVLFLMDDGQTVSMWLHNPDTSPSRLAPMDELISWKWMLNKRDVTIVVAPERGVELNAREVARRLMRLVEKNSAAFKKANEKAAERAATIAEVDAEIVQLSGELAELQHKIEVARVAFEAKPSAAVAPIEPGTPEFVEWEDAVTRAIVDALEVSRSDAQAMMEVYPDAFREAFEAGVAPEVAAKIVTVAGQAAEPSAEYRTVHAEGYAIGEAAGRAGESHLPDDSAALTGKAAEYAAKGLDVAGWLREGFRDGWDAGRAGEPAETDEQRAERIRATPGAQRTQEDIDWYNARSRAAQAAQEDAKRQAEDQALRNTLGADALAYLETISDPKTRARTQTHLADTIRNNGVVKFNRQYIEDYVANGYRVTLRGGKTVLSKGNAWAPVTATGAKYAQWLVGRLNEGPDLTYKVDAENLFAQFFAETPAGEKAWAKIAEQTEGTGKVLTNHLVSTIEQLQAAGYVVKESAGAVSDAEADAIAAELAAPAAAPATPAWKSRDFDPTNPDNYAAIAGDTEALRWWQDVLDAAFQGRLFEVRNALRAMGWKPREAGSNELAKYGQVFDARFNHANTPGRNVVAVEYGIVGQAGYVRDDFGHSPEELAKKVDAKVVPVRTLLANVGAALAAAGWVAAGTGEWRKGDWKVSHAEDSDFLAVEVREGAADTNAGFVVFFGKEPEEVAAKVENIVREADGLENLAPAVPTDAELEAEAMAGHEVKRIARNASLPKAERDALPVATLGKLFLYTEADWRRAVKAVEEAETQRDFKPFDPSAVKMPTAAQLGVTKDYVATVLLSDDKSALEPGWSNGFLIDFEKTPRFIESAMAKRFGDLVRGSGVRRFVKSDLLSRFLPKAKANATDEGKPLALWDGLVQDKDKKGNAVNVPRPCVVLMNEGSQAHATVQLPYFAYFYKTYPGCEFMVGTQATDMVLVRHRGAPVGIIMPFDLKKLGNIAGRVTKALTAPAPLTPEQQVDAAYAFENATADFKRMLVDSLAETDYSAFATAKAMDEAAKARGMSIHWDVADGAMLDSVSPLFDYAGEGSAALGAAKELLHWFRQFVKSGQGLGIVPEHLPNWGGTVVDAEGARKALKAIVDAAVNTRGGERPLNARQAARLADFAADAATIAEYLAGKRDHGAIGKLRTPEMKARYPHVDTQLWLDAVQATDGGDIVGTIYLGGDVVGRAEITSGDGKAMVFVGATGDTRVTFKSKVDGQVLRAMWSDDDAGEMIGWLADMLDGGPGGSGGPGGEPKPDQPAGSPLDEFEAKGGEAWQVTRAEWTAIMSGHVRSLGQAPDDASVYGDFHRSQVQAALDAGKAVPAAVLADYPGMAARSEEDKAASAARADAAMAQAAAAMGGRTASQEAAREQATEVAMIVRQQLGGQKFVVMTGARDFLALLPEGDQLAGLQFSLPSNFATGGINRVRIRLNDQDTYDVEFGKHRAGAYKTIAQHDGIYADGLSELFTRVTGLDTSMGTMRGAGEPAPRRVTKAEARDTYDALAYAVSDLQGHTDTELRRADAPARLDPKVAAVKELQARGWPADVSQPDGLLANADAVLKRWNRLQAEGLTGDMGRGEADTYLRTEHGLGEEAVAAILATPSYVNNVSLAGRSIEQPQYKVADLDAAAKRAAAPAAGAATYPDGRTIPTAGADVYTRAAGMFGLPAVVRGVVEAGRGGELRVRVGGASGTLGESYAGRKVLPLTEDWTVVGEVHPQDAKQRAAEAKLEAEQAERQAAREAELNAAAERNGTLDPATVQLGDVLELADGHLVYVAEKHASGLFVTSVTGDAYQASGLGSDMRGIKKLDGYPLPTDGSIVIGSYDEGRRALFADGWQPVEWSDEAGNYLRIGSGNQAPGATSGQANDPAMEEDRAYLQSFVDGTADVMADDITARLEPLAEKYEGHAEMGDLLNRAVEAYSAKMMELAQAAMK